MTIVENPKKGVLKYYMIMIMIRFQHPKGKNKNKNNVGWRGGGGKILLALK